MKKGLAIALLTATAFSQQLQAQTATQDAGQFTTITNGNLWIDSEGNDVQAHGAGFLKVGDTWYMIGEDRSSSWNPDVNMYSSKDLVNWKFERKIIENHVTHPDLGSKRMIERPKLMYCAKTKQYVVWCHWESSNYGASEAGVFYSNTINGPYTYHWGGRPLGVKSRDCNIFVDDDGTAYFISTIEENQHLGLFRLSDDYLSAVEYTELFKWKSREAPAIVRVGDTYYMLSSACTGWDPNPCMLSYSKSLTEGWSELKQVGNSIAFDTQAASILTIKGTKQTTHLYVGDRWQDPRLPESKTIIFPISFTADSCVFNYTRQFDINYTTGEWYPTSTADRYISKKHWRVLDYSSAETTRGNYTATNAIDGDPTTLWHTQLPKEQPRGQRANRWDWNAPKVQHRIMVDMGRVHTLNGFLCTPRTDNSAFGLVRSYTFYVSENGKDWKPVSKSNWMPYWTEVDFAPCQARYFMLTSTERWGVSVAEIDVY
jgi:sucrose-6-phosphate hydrolase SacC (GH32 family)